MEHRGDLVLRVGASGRPNRIKSGKLDNPTSGRWFDNTAFVMPPLCSFGNSSLDFLPDDGLSQWDCSLLKNFAVREGIKLQFRGEFFNVLNHPDFGTPRIGQFALKLVFYELGCGAAPRSPSLS